MRRGEFDAAGAPSASALRSAYYEVLQEAVEAVGVDAVATRSGVDQSVIAAIEGGDTPELTLEAAAAILASAGDSPPGEAIEAEARDILLLGMTQAVLDVDGVAAGLDVDIDAKTIQQQIEGRHPMTLETYARLHHFIANEG